MTTGHFIMLGVLVFGIFLVFLDPKKIQKKFNKE